MEVVREWSKETIVCTEVFLPDASLNTVCNTARYIFTSQHNLDAEVLLYIQMIL
jgi:hypothetical protein